MTTKNSKPKADKPVKAASNEQDAAVTDALKQASEAREYAIAELAEFEAVQNFEMADAASDKNGELTKVLTLDTESDAVIELFMFEGNPFSIDAAEGGIDESKPLIVEFLRAMSNVDLTDSSILKSIGWSGISKAREAVRSFFMLRFISDLELKGITAPAK